MLPVNLMSYFYTNDTVHNYQTRNSNNFHLPHMRLSVSQKSIFFQGPKLWNDLPLDIKTSPSINVFKRRFKKYLISTYV